jgi:hypothetical protein
MYYKFLRSKILAVLFLLCSLSAFSQLVGSEVQLWEKADPASREAVSCKDENLLNFHCGIKDKLIKKYIKYSKNKSHTLSLVHTSKEDELIWENSEKQAALGNNTYQKSEGKSIEIRRRPSIFSYTSTADADKGKTDTLRIKFEDKNLYEMIFIPKKAKTLDLNKIHSYLSIKYGISLEKGKYYGSDGKVIWDPEKHKDYKYRPTGLGRDDGNELYQKQSANQADQFLTVGKNDIKRTNIENNTLLDNNNFVMWSDDNKGLSLERDGNFDVLQRNWEINFIGSSIPKNDYKVRIDKSVVNPKSLPLVYWMFLKNPDGEITKIQGVDNERYVTFSKVDFKKENETAQFTFAVSPLKDQKGENAGTNSGSVRDEKDLPLDLSKIVLYPNPVKKDQNFTIVFPPMDNLIISIYDGGGRLITLDKVSSTAGSYMNHLPVQSSYLINLTQNGKIIKTFKLIVD